MTHYPPLCELEHVYPEHVSNYHMAFLLNEPDVAADADGACACVRLLEGKMYLVRVRTFRYVPVDFCVLILPDGEVTPEFITFLYQLTEGAAGRSYGLNVARLADIPGPVLQTAACKARELESTVEARR